jgi:hypothetical protein
LLRQNRREAGEAPFVTIENWDDLAPQVGLEPTTLRLTARHLQILALLRIAIYSAFSLIYACHLPGHICGYRPQLLAIFNQSTHKSPHSAFAKDSNAADSPRFLDAPWNLSLISLNGTPPRSLPNLRDQALPCTVLSTTSTRHQAQEPTGCRIPPLPASVALGRAGTSLGTRKIMVMFFSTRSQ